MPERWQWRFAHIGCWIMGHLWGERTEVKDHAGGWMQQYEVTARRWCLRCRRCEQWVRTEFWSWR